MSLFSRRRVLIVAIFILGVSALLFVLEKRNKPQILSRETLFLTGAHLFGKTAGADQDNDGLKDWEETLWKTDSRNADSDGDGTLDGEEVNQNRNPAVKGPNDTLNSQKNQAGETEENWRNDPTLSETDRLAREFFARYWTLKQTTGVISDEDRAALIREFLDSGFGGNAEKPPSLLSLSDLPVAADGSGAALKKFGNEMGSLILKNSPKEKGGELVIFQRAVSSGNIEILKELDPVIAGYRAVVSGAKDIAVPETARESTLAILNSMSRITGALQSVKLAFSDPLRALIGLSEYQKALNSMSQPLMELKSLFLKNAVSFTTDEPGYIFIYAGR